MASLAAWEYTSVDPVHPLPTPLYPCPPCTSPIPYPTPYPPVPPVYTRRPYRTSVHQTYRTEQRTAAGNQAYGSSTD